MTRLLSDWIEHMEDDIQSYEEQLKKKTCLNLLELSAKAWGIASLELMENVSTRKIAVIPISSGEGIIGPFAESVAVILKKMGANVFITAEQDVAGIREAAERDADILFMADDDAYIALNIKTGKVSDNNLATSLGFVTALEEMAGDLTNKAILVLGCGIIGRNFMEILKKRKSRVFVYDSNQELLKSLREKEVGILNDPEDIKNFRYILDGTNHGGWLNKSMLAEQVWISAPGLPLSLDEETYEAIQDHVVHDCLEIGTAVMLGQVCSLERS